MDMIELGKRIKLVRNEILQMNQQELAARLQSHQGVISRLEKGLGGSIELLLQVVDYFNKRGLNGHLIFAKNFSIDLLPDNTKAKMQAMPNKLLSEKLSSLKTTLEISQKQIAEIESLLGAVSSIKLKQKNQNR